MTAFRGQSGACAGGPRSPSGGSDARVRDAAAAHVFGGFAGTLGLPARGHEQLAEHRLQAARAAQVTKQVDPLLELEAAVCR
jgi:hypothetical protein